MYYQSLFQVCLLLKGMPVCFAQQGLRGGQVFSVSIVMVCLQFRLQFHYLTVCSRLYVIDITDRFCLVGTKRRLVTISYEFRLVRLAVFLCLLIDWLLGYGYYILDECVINTRLSTLVSMFDSLFVDTFLFPPCYISHVTLGGGASALYEQQLWRNMPLTFDAVHVLHI